jgi:hypothetical protein
MYEYIIENNQTLETDVIFGYNAKDAFKRAKISPIDWTVVAVDYID